MVQLELSTISSGIGSLNNQIYNLIFCVLFLYGLWLKEAKMGKMKKYRVIILFVQVY